MTYNYFSEYITEINTWVEVINKLIKKYRKPED